MASYVPCINIGNKTYLKKEISKNEISRDFTYSTTNTTTQYAIINHVAAAEIDDPNFYNIYITLHAWLIEVVS